MTLQKEELTTDTSKVLILGSGSTARKELLSSVGLVPDKIEIPNVDESLKLNESPHNYVRRVAKLKANTIMLKPIKQESHVEQKEVNNLIKHITTD